MSQTSPSTAPATDVIGPDAPDDQPDGPDLGGRRLLNATALMASGTAVSRVLGLVRAMLIAFILGNGTRQADGFNFANTVPTSLYLLLAGGTLNNVLVPQIVRAVNHDSDGGRAYVDRIVTGFVLVMGVITVALTVATPVVMGVYVPAWTTPAMAEHWRAMVLMSYLCLPQVFFYGVFFLVGQVLNAREKFGPMMWAPAVNNLVSIAVLVLYLTIWGQTALTGAPFTDAQAWLLAAGSTLGIVVQMLVLMPYLARAGFHYRPRFDLKGTGLGRTFHAAKWMVGYVALTSLAQIVVSRLASTATGAEQTAGGWLTYQNAYLIWVLPHSLLTVSLATAMLPAASRAAVAGNLADVAAETRRALRLATTFLLPASLGLLALADPVTRLAFGHGAGANDYHFVTWALIGLALGLVPFTIQYVYLRAFFAMDNTKTPFLLQIWISGANAVFAIVLVMAWDDPATVAARLGVAYTLSYVLGAFVTHWTLKRRLPQLDGRDTWLHLGRVTLATLPAAVVAFGISFGLDRFDSLAIQILALVLAAGAAVVVFFFTAKRLGIPETAQLLGILRRGGRSEGADDATGAIATDLEAEETAGAAQPLLSGEEVAAEEPVEQVNTDPDGVGVFVPVVPEPGPETGDVSEYPEAPGAGSDAESGRLLGGRFRLDERLAVQKGTQTWLAHDEVLGRAVLVHLLPRSDRRTARVLAAARAAAVATDSRFLRVLDVLDGDAEAFGLSDTSCLVYEYASGLTLARLLEDGPLTGVEAAWVVSEVADALAPLHAQGQFHRHLNPATVLITSNGNVKVLGFGVGITHELPPAGVETDVAAIGDLLYAALVAQWPHGEAFGLPAAPRVNGVAVPPASARGGVAPGLDRIQQRIAGTNNTPGVRLVTAQAIAGELDGILGQARADADLRARLGAPVAGSVPPVPTPATGRTMVTSPMPEDEEDSGAFVHQVFDHAEQFTPVPPPGSARSVGRLPLILIASVVVSVVGLVGATVAGARPAVTSSAGTIAVVSVDDFDPKADGGSGGENSSTVGRAIDGNLATVWFTEKYRKADFGSKPGVGLVLDLGAVHAVTGLTVHTEGGGTDFDVRVPKDAATSTPPETQSGWDTVRQVKNAGDAVELDLHGTVRTRYLLIYLTSLPPIGGGQYRAGIAEVTVTGS